MKTVLFIYSKGAGTTFWRVEIPMEELRRAYSDRIEIIDLPFDKDAKEIVLTANVISKADVIHVQGFALPPNLLMFMKNVMKPGARLYFDVDDYWKMDKKNQGLIQARKTGKKTFQDGDRHSRFMAWGVADGLTTTNQILAALYKPINPNAIILPNGIPEERWNVAYEERKTREKDGKIRIGWMGGVSHQRDLAEVVRAICDTCRENKDVVFTAAGWEVRQFKEFLELYLEDESKIEIIPWTGLLEYQNSLKQFDIGIAPLYVPHIFNKGKSDIKWQEYSLLGIPSILTDYGPYASVPNQFATKIGNDNSYFDWREAFQDHIARPEHYRERAENARKFVLQNRTIRHQIKHWVELYERS